MTSLTCFKAYDIRGRLGIDLDEGIAYRIGSAFAVALNAKTVVLGRDVRASSEALANCVAQGLIDQGCEVLDLGLSGTEEMYLATNHFGSDGGICVTASHNPIDYNGMKMVRAGSAPLDAASGLARIKELAEANAFEKRATIGKIRDVAEEARKAYVERICQFVDISALKPLKILVNAGHGTAGPTFDAIAERLAELGAPLQFERIFTSQTAHSRKAFQTRSYQKTDLRPQTPFALQALTSVWHGTVILTAASSLITREPSSTANMS
jgi:phosphomannomutase